MKYSLLLLLTFLLISNIALARTGSTISGKVMSKQEPAVGANIVVLKENNVLVKAELADENGSFSITEIPNGTYTLKVLLTGYETHIVQELTVSGNVIVPDITLQEKASQLTEVSVRSQKPLVEAYADKLVVNVENSIVNAGSTVMEVLQRAPNVSVDQNDNISLKGRQGVTIMINGKRVPVQGADLANVLKGMPAGSVEKIELISNPGARYDAAGTGGIINIKLKKDMRMGANGTATAGYTQGIFPKYNGGLGFNYRNNKITLYSNYNTNLRYGMNWLDLERRFISNGVADTIYRQHNYANITYNTHMLNVGLDYALSPKTTIGAVVNGAVNRIDFLGDNTSDVLNANREQVSYFRTLSNNISRWKNYSANLNFRHTFDSTGKELSIDADHAYYTLRTDQDVFTDFHGMSGEVIRDPNILLGEMDGHTDIRSLKADYVHPVNQTMRLETGLKTSFVVADNAPTFYNNIAGVISYDAAKSNHFVYNENINAAYINGNKDWDKWSVQLGLRMEQTRIKGEEKVTDTSFTKEYAQLFPSLGVVRHLDKTNDLGLTLSRRIERPNYRQLNPFRDYLDLSTINQGNPNLNPALTYSAEVNHIYKGRFMTSFTYSRTTDVITQVIRPGESSEGTKVTIITDDNLATNNVYSLSGAYPLQITKWWNSTNSFNVYHSHYEGNLVNTPLAAGTTAFQVSSNNNFILPNDWTAEISGWYQSGQQYAFMYLEAMYAINLGVQRSLWDKKATVRISVNDILWKQNPSGSNSFTTYNEDFVVKRDSRTVGVNFTYRFGRKTVAPVRRRSGGAEEEKRRAASGAG